MANSPAHQLGELIGDFFEFSIIRYLLPIITEKGYYLDYKHPRAARGFKREVIGIDYKGNQHKLDIVVEENGSETVNGTPKAFIEMAWRRYVKHSKNKVQEIAGAILPLIETHAKEMPFYAAVLAGEFTDNSIVQLRSQGFYVLYFNYEEICTLFDQIGICIRWDEDTSENDIERIVDEFQDLDTDELDRLREIFFATYAEQLSMLATALCNALDTTITEIVVIPIHGNAKVLASVPEAVRFVLEYDENSQAPILRYEISVRYSNGDEYTMKCADKTKAIQFLNQYS